MENMTIFWILAFTLVISLLWNIKLKLSNQKNKKNYHREKIWKILYYVENKKEKLDFKNTESFFESISKNIKEGKLSEIEINEVKNYFYDVVDTQMACRIEPLMDLRNSFLPSFRNLFPKNYNGHFFDFFEKKESIISVIYEYEDFLELINLRRDDVSKFEIKLKSHIPAILDSVLIRLDIDGEKDTTLLYFRLTSFLKTLERLSEFSVVDKSTLCPFMVTVRMRLNKIDSESRRANGEPEKNHVPLEEFEKKLFEEIQVN